jgi:hypothetical protein
MKFRCYKIIFKMSADSTHEDSNGKWVAVGIADLDDLDPCGAFPEIFAEGTTPEEAFHALEKKVLAEVREWVDRAEAALAKVRKFAIGIGAIDRKDP